MAPLLSDSLSFLLFLAGAILVVAEAFVPGAHLFVLGVALLTAGIVGLLLPPSVGIFAPLILVAVVIAVTGITLWGYRKLDLYSGDGTAETSHSGSLRGQFGTVTERVSADTGEVKLDDGGFTPYYQARSVDDEIAAGAEVMVVDPGGGNVVTVEPVATGDDIDRALARERERSERGTEANRTQERESGESTRSHENTENRDEWNVES